MDLKFLKLKLSCFSKEVCNHNKNIFGNNEYLFIDHNAQPNTFTTHISDGESHFTVTVPSTSLSQQQEPERFNPQSAFCMIIQLVMNLKFLFTFVILLRICLKKQIYIIAYLISPNLCFIYIITFLLQMVNNHSVDLFLDKRPYVIKYCFAGLTHQILESIIIQISYLNDYYNLKLTNMEDKQQKQAFLRDNILNAGYDPTEFVDFLNTKLPIGDNIDLCSLDELQAVVNQYIAYKKQQQASSQIFYQMQQSGVQIPLGVSEIKTKSLLFTNYTPHMLEYQYCKTFQCKKIIDKYNHLKSIKCIVSNPQRKNTEGFFGIGATSFLQFKVQTIETNWKVGRRYSDFIWLRQYLRKVYPTFIIPPIPEKKASKKTQRHIDKRMKILEYFLNDLVSIRQIVNDQYVVGFLSLNDHVKFQNLKKQSLKVKSFSGINDIKNLQGKVDSKLCEQNKVFLEEMQKKRPQMQKLYKQITRGGKKLQEQITNEVNTLYEIGNYFADLHQIMKNITNKIPKSQPVNSLNDIYITLNNMMIQWGNLLRNQHQFLEKNFNTFFKYVRNQLTGFSEIINKEQQLQTQYNKFKINLEKKKDKIFSQHDPQKWDIPSKQVKSLSKETVHDKSQAYKIMLPKENAALQKMKTNLFLYIDQFYEHGMANFTRKTYRYCENFKEFSIKVKVNNQQLGEMWMQMSNNFSGPSKGPQSVKIKPEQVVNQEIYQDF